MNRFLYAICTILIGLVCQIVFTRYLTVFEVSPQLLLLFVVAHGFLCGPIMGEVLGFSWGLISDTMGVNLFGLQALLLALTGYLAGSMRRRVASDRPTAQFVTAFIVSFFYWLTVPFIANVFGEFRGARSVVHLIYSALLNVVFVTAVFWITEWWMRLWRVEPEHM
jgi:rod shape-determining protein MreD